MSTLPFLFSLTFSNPHMVYTESAVACNRKNCATERRGFTILDSYIISYNY
jgi:hypothetical protein